VVQEIVTLRPGTHTHLPRITTAFTAQRPVAAAIPPPPDKVDATAPEPLGFATTVLVRTGNVPPTLDHRGGFILTFVDGMSSVEDIADASGLPRADVLQILRELLQNGTLIVRA
jgi:hypothetical protein